MCYQFPWKASDRGCLDLDSLTLTSLTSQADGHYSHVHCNLRLCSTWDDQVDLNDPSTVNSRTHLCSIHYSFV